MTENNKNHNMYSKLYTVIMTGLYNQWHLKTCRKWHAGINLIEVSIFVGQIEQYVQFAFDMNIVKAACLLE